MYLHLLYKIIHRRRPQTIDWNPLLVSAGSPVLGHLSWVTCPRCNCPKCPGCSGGQPILQFTLLDFALLYLWSFVLRGLQSNASNIFMTRMHATPFCHHGARRFESQPSKLPLLPAWPPAWPPAVPPALPSALLPAL